MCCGGFAGNLAYVSEKLVSFAAMTAVILCIIITLTISLGLGVGVGYNYCYVDLKIVTEEPDTGGKVLRAGDITDIPDMPEMPEMPMNRRSLAHSTQPRRMLPIPEIKHTMAIPLNGDFDFPSLLAKLRARNRNVTLELVTISLWLTCTGLICCLVLTITVSLGMGIGLGYNYCFVGTKSKHKHVMGRYVYPPGHPACCAHYQREGGERERALDNRNMDAMSDENALRMPPELPEYETRLNNSDTLGVPVEYPYFANSLHTGDKTDDYHPIFSDSETLNEKESGVETIVGVATNDDSTENNPEINYIAERTSSIFPIVNDTTEKRKDMLELNSVNTESSSTTASTTETMTDILSDTSEPPPETIETTTPLANDPSSKKEKKMVIPITGLDLISILSKLSAENKNYSLQIITT